MWIVRKAILSSWDQRHKSVYLTFRSSKWEVFERYCVSSRYSKCLRDTVLAGEPRPKLSGLDFGLFYQKPTIAEADSASSFGPPGGLVGCSRRVGVHLGMQLIKLGTVPALWNIHEASPAVPGNQGADCSLICSLTFHSPAWMAAEC